MKFNINSPIIEFITTVCNYAALNIIFLICCIPFVTIGPAIIALYQVTMRDIRNESGYIISSFFKAFIENFKNGFFIFLFFFVTGAILIFNISFFQSLPDFFHTILFGIMLLLIFFWSISFLYIFPLLARFQNTLIRSLKNSLFIAMTNIKATILLIVLHAFILFLCYYIQEFKIFMILLGFSFLAYCNSYILVNVFKNYES